jgi:hypothetical protein
MENVVSVAEATLSPACGVLAPQLTTKAEL